jgi:TM2 domain-containing membrane protein YozV
MKRSPLVAGVLSFLIPGLGQIYGGQSFKGGMIIAAAIVIGSVNIIILPLVSIANPVIPAGVGNPRSVWAYWIPRIVHDVAAVWSIAFWIWAVVDAAMAAKKGKILKRIR